MKTAYLMLVVSVVVCGVACKKSGNGGQTSPITLTGFSPTHGFVGDTIRLSGAGFLPADSVLFNGVLAPSLFNVGSTSMQVVVPVGASSGAVQVVHNGFKASSDSSFTVDQPTAAQATVTHLLDIQAHPTNGASGVRMLYTFNGLFITGPGTGQDAVYRVDLTTNGVSPYIKVPAGSEVTGIAAHNGADSGWLLISAQSVSGNDHQYNWRFGQLTSCRSTAHVYFNSLKFVPDRSVFIGTDYSNNLYHIGIATYGGNTDCTESDTLINSQLVGVPSDASAMLGVGASGKVFVFANHALYQLQADNTLKVLAGKPGTAGYQDGPGGSALFHDGGYARGNAIAVDGSDNVYVADFGSGCIRKVDKAGNVMTVCGNPNAKYSYTGQGDKMRFYFDSSFDLCFGADDKTLYVLSTNDGNKPSMPNSIYKVSLP
ncbi:MAG: peptidase [Bacteroidetes bacterium]|nr:peptidase [Bacteroidota bacterium]